MSQDIDKKVPVTLPVVLGTLKARLFNLQSSKRAFLIGKTHYDLGNDLFSAMLDKRMIYSCGYWKNASIVDEAQEAKLGLICKKLRFRKGMKVLDVGCGWGGLLKYAATTYGIEGVGITVSKEQAELAQQSCQGLPIEIRLQDCRDLKESFDRIVSVGMFEHVGHKNYRIFMQAMHKNLKDEGLFLLHTIGGNQTIIYTDSWIHKYIFPRRINPLHPADCKIH